jgi:hypothetical protein
MSHAAAGEPRTLAGQALIDKASIVASSGTATNTT